MLRYNKAISFAHNSSHKSDDFEHYLHSMCIGDCCRVDIRHTARARIPKLNTCIWLRWCVHPVRMCVNLSQSVCVRATRTQQEGDELAHSHMHWKYSGVRVTMWDFGQTFVLLILNILWNASTKRTFKIIKIEENFRTLQIVIFKVLKWRRFHLILHFSWFSAHRRMLFKSEFYFELKFGVNGLPKRNDEIPMHTNARTHSLADGAAYSLRAHTHTCMQHISVSFARTATLSIRRAAHWCEWWIGNIRSEWVVCAMALCNHGFLSTSTVAAERQRANAYKEETRLRKMGVLLPGL